MNNFNPTYLCIKQHSVTGLKYLCKTQKPYKQMLTYKGSGKHWALHLRKHNKEYVETIWFCLFYDSESIKEFALMCSEQWDIVNSPEWANLKPEDGLEGGCGKGRKYPNRKSRGPDSEEMKAQKSAKLKNKPRTEEAKQNMRKPKSKIRSAEDYAKVGLSHRGKHSGPKSSSVKEKISKTLTGKKRGPQKQKICPHCNKEGAGGAMTRYHFDNCKLKNSVSNGC